MDEELEEELDDLELLENGFEVLDETPEDEEELFPMIPFAGPSEADVDPAPDLSSSNSSGTWRNGLIEAFFFTSEEAEVRGFRVSLVLERLPGATPSFEDDDLSPEEVEAGSLGRPSERKTD